MRDNVSNMVSGAPITTPNQSPSNAPANFNAEMGKTGGKSNPGRFNFVNQLSTLFGWKKSSPNKKGSVNNLDFVKVDSQSDLRIAQAKIAKTFKTKISGKLEEYFDAYLQDVSSNYKVLEDRNKRIAEIAFALANDPFLSQAADLYADEATQIDIGGKLIQVDCADPRMKEKMEDLMEQWGITQNRLRAVAYNLAAYGDAFWSNKVTKNGVVRINPLDIYQVKERLEFNPVRVASDIALQKGYMTAINRSAKLQALFDTLESEENEEFADLFDSKLFGFALSDDMVVPAWDITHFRLNAEQSEFFPMGRSLFLKALAPFRQCNATMVLQSLARVMSFPVTVYNVKTAPGMDEALQFDKINQVREEYENIGDSGAGTEAFSVNTKVWAPEGLITLEMQTPDIDINATGDIEMYQDRVAIASGIPKGYLVQEWGGFGNSAISLIEQFKPFARKVFTIQSAILEGLSNLFRLHFAITGDYDYRESFILSMKFPNEESSDARLAAKQNSLNLSTQVLQTVSSIIGAINDPLPPEIIRDILTKFSFLDPDDIKKWIKPNPNAKAQQGAEQGAGAPEEFGGMGGGGAPMGGEIPMSGGTPTGGEPMGGGLEEPASAPSATQGEENPLAQNIQNNESIRRKKNYKLMEDELRYTERKDTLIKRYLTALDEDIIQEATIKLFERVDEAQMNNRHYKYARIEDCNLPMYKVFQKPQPNTNLKEESEQSKLASSILNDDSLSWKKIKEMLRESIENTDEIMGEQQNDGTRDNSIDDSINENYDSKDSDIEHSKKISEILNS